MVDRLQGRVLRVQGGFSFVLVGEQVVRCSLRGKRKYDATAVYPGDHVAISLEADGNGVVETVFPRNNSLTRPYVANIDLLVITSSLADPPADLLLADRMLVICFYRGIRPLLCFTKTDLVDGPEMLSTVRDYYDQTDIPLFFLSATTGTGFSDFQAYIEGETATFAGNSGVGKSSIINRLLDIDHVQETAAISDKLRRGRHTTRYVEFFPYRGSMIADTPGFNVLSLPQEMEPQTLSRLYPDYLPHLSACKYSNCLHDKEPGCKIKEMVEAGRLRAERYQHYLYLLHELTHSTRRS